MRLIEFSSEVNMIPFIYECGEESLLLKLANQDRFSILVYEMLFITILFQQLDQTVSTRCFNADPSFHLLRAVDCYCLCFACCLAAGWKNGEEQCPLPRAVPWGTGQRGAPDGRRTPKPQNPTDRSLYNGGGGLGFSTKSRGPPANSAQCLLL
jgi:hypothetical protein